MALIPRGGRLPDRLSQDRPDRVANHSSLYNSTSKFMGANSSDDIAISQPRHSHLFFVVFNFSPSAAIGNLEEAITNGRLHVLTKGMDIPTPKYTIEKLNAYNRKHLLKTKMEYDPVTVTFRDDSTSYIQGLLEAYHTHYHHAPLSFRDSDADYASDFRQLLNNDSIPHLGLRIPKGKFIESIELYDLGTEPSSTNIYKIINPQISDFTMPSKDYDSDDIQEISLSFEFEHLIRDIGVNWSLDSDLINKLPALYQDRLYAVSNDALSNVSSSGSLIHEDKAGTWGNSGQLSEEINLWLDNLREQQSQGNPNFILDQDTLQYNILQNSARINARVEQYNNTVLDGLSIIGVTARDLVVAFQKSIQGGKINIEDLQQNLFNAATKGSPIQSVREVVKVAKQVKQAIEQGRFIDVALLVEEGINLVSREVSRLTVDGLSAQDNIAKPSPRTGSWLGDNNNPIVDRIPGGAWLG